MRPLQTIPAGEPAMSRTLIFLAAFLPPLPAFAADPLPGTKPLTEEGDLAAKMVAGIDKYLMRELAESGRERQKRWKNQENVLKEDLEDLKKALGVVDQRVPANELEYVATDGHEVAVGVADKYQMYSVRWPVFEGVEGEGLLLEPIEKPLATVIVLPDADWTPEMLAGLARGLPDEQQLARRLAENGCRVLVPVLIDRQDTWSGNPRVGRMTNQTHREFIYRMAFEMGRHIVGYEVQKVLAAVDLFDPSKGNPPLAVCGHGEGGLIALCSGAVDLRIGSVGVSGYFGPTAEIWKEPIYRNIWGIQRNFGFAGLARFYQTRNLIIGAADFPVVEGAPAEKPDRRGAAPGKLGPLEPKLIATELQPALTFFRAHDPKKFQFETPDDKGGAAQMVRSLFFATHEASGNFLASGEPARDRRKDYDPGPRQKRQFDQLVAFTQKLLLESGDRRNETFWKKLDLSSLENYEKSTQPFRKQLWEEVIGKLPAPAKSTMNPRSRQIYDEPKWKGYEVTLDLYPDVFAYGILLLPKDMKEGEKRPVVVCQHGLEGKPTDVCNPKEKSKYYNSFGAQLADRGYIVFAPQNPYIGQDKFRVLQRKANPLGLSLFSFIIRQHERILDWLAEQPFVDSKRMAFYGLSYGGKTAMRVPAVLPAYCLSICSGDFNEWVWKNATVDYKGSYMFSGEYEMPEFNLGHTFNYAEMAALIAPRPFMVERGHDDPVGIDEQVAFEYAKVRRLYSRLQIPDRTKIEFFDGGHEIHGKGTFEFLEKHLKWPAK
jgi:dienelactone hydrolase